MQEFAKVSGSYVVLEILSGMITPLRWKFLCSRNNDFIFIFFFDFFLAIWNYLKWVLKVLICFFLHFILFFFFLFCHFSILSVSTYIFFFPLSIFWLFLGINVSCYLKCAYLHLLFFFHFTFCSFFSSAFPFLFFFLSVILAFSFYFFIFQYFEFG